MAKRLPKPAAAADDDDVTGMLLPPGIDLDEAPSETPALTVVAPDQQNPDAPVPTDATPADRTAAVAPSRAAGEPTGGHFRATATHGLMRRVQIKLPRAQRKALQRLVLDNKHQSGFVVRDWEVLVALLQSAPDTAAGIKDLVYRTADQVEQRIREDGRTQVLSGDLPDELVAPIDEHLDHLLLDEDFRCSLTGVLRALVEEGPKTAQELREAVTKARATYGRGRVG